MLSTGRGSRVTARVEPRLISLREAAGSTIESMPVETAAGLAARQIATVSPTPSGEWLVSNVSKVGVIRLGGVQVMIEPKVPLERLFYLLSRGRGWGSWFEESVSLGTIAELYPAIAEAFTGWAERALSTGVLRGYREMRSAEPAIRGKWLVSEQIRIRHGMPLPAELQYDEFTADIAENQLVRSAIRRVLAFLGLPDSLYARLKRIDRQLAGVSVLARGGRLPVVQFDRRNARYRPVVALAELILTNGSYDHRVASTAATGFLLDLPRVFEQFVEVEVTQAARPHGGEVVAQFESALDRDGYARIRPDLVWRSSGRVRAVFDAKYKAEKPAGFPNADVYQMLAYCIRHRLTTGHLIYAAGNEVPRSYVIEQAGVEIVCHSLALDSSPAEISRQIDEIVDMSSREAVLSEAP